MEDNCFNYFTVVLTKNKNKLGLRGLRVKLAIIGWGRAVSGYSQLVPNTVKCCLIHKEITNLK
jgi:hypothetical protein